MKITLTNDNELLEAVGLLAPESSRASRRSWIKEGRIQVDGRKVTDPSFVVKSGQSISLGPKPKFIQNEIRVVYEDAHIIVVDKPSGMLSVAAAFEKSETVHSFIKKTYKPRKVYVVHRLDQDTSGVMLFAFSEAAYDKLKKMFEAHDLERGYTAIVEGGPPSAEGTWQSLQYEDDNYVVRTTNDPTRGRLAVTHFCKRGGNKRYSRLELRLETGRKNQIRVHCQEAGCPVAGDKKYGASSDPVKRLCLHARLLAFRHPITGKNLRFVSPEPEEFRKLVPDENA